MFMDPKMKQWLAKARENGLSQIDIEEQLRAQGWKEVDIVKILSEQISTNIPLKQNKSESDHRGLKIFLLIIAGTLFAGLVAFGLFVFHVYPGTLLGSAETRYKNATVEWMCITSTTNPDREKLLNQLAKDIGVPREQLYSSSDEEINKQMNDWWDAKVQKVAKKYGFTSADALYEFSSTSVSQSELQSQISSLAAKRCK